MSAHRVTIRTDEREVAVQKREDVQDVAAIDGLHESVPHLTKLLLRDVVSRRVRGLRGNGLLGGSVNRCAEQQGEKDRSAHGHGF